MVYENQVPKAWGAKILKKDADRSKIAQTVIYDRLMKELCLGYSKIGGSMNLKVQNKGLYAKPNKKMGYIQLKYFSFYTIFTLSKKLLTVQCQRKWCVKH